MLETVAGPPSVSAASAGAKFELSASATTAEYGRARQNRVRIDGRFSLLVML
jgi:hypothetical protein